MPKWKIFLTSLFFFKFKMYVYGLPQADLCLGLIGET